MPCKIIIQHIILFLSLEKVCEVCLCEHTASADLAIYTNILKEKNISLMVNKAGR